jgi:hypothetical protein
MQYNGSWGTNGVENTQAKSLLQRFRAWIQTPSPHIVTEPAFASLDEVEGAAPTTPFSQKQSFTQTNGEEREFLHANKNIYTAYHHRGSVKWFFIACVVCCILVPIGIQLLWLALEHGDGTVHGHRWNYDSQAEKHRGGGGGASSYFSSFIKLPWFPLNEDTVGTNAANLAILPWRSTSAALGHRNSKQLHQEYVRTGYNVEFVIGTVDFFHDYHAQVQLPASFRSDFSKFSNKNSSSSPSSSSNITNENETEAEEEEDGEEQKEEDFVRVQSKRRIRRISTASTGYVDLTSIETISKLSLAQAAKTEDDDKNSSLSSSSGTGGSKKKEKEADDIRKKFTGKLAFLTRGAEGLAERMTIDDQALHCHVNQTFLSHHLFLGGSVYMKNAAQSNHTVGNTYIPVLQLKSNQTTERQTLTVGHGHLEQLQLVVGEQSRINVTDQGVFIQGPLIATSSFIDLRTDANFKSPFSSLAISATSSLSSATTAATSTTKSTSVLEKLNLIRAEAMTSNGILTVQDLEQAWPDAIVSLPSLGARSTDSTVLISHLIRCIRELKREIEILKNKP